MPGTERADAKDWLPPDTGNCSRMSLWGSPFTLTSSSTVSRLRARKSWPSASRAPKTVMMPRMMRMTMPATMNDQFLKTQMPSAVSSLPPPKCVSQSSSASSGMMERMDAITRNGTKHRISSVTHPKKKKAPKQPTYAMR